jgi:hypothetical protein
MVRKKLKKFAYRWKKDQTETQTKPTYFCAGSQPLMAVHMLNLHGKSIPLPYFPVTAQRLVYKLVAAP